jgi:hypothetical protein
MFAELRAVRRRGWIPVVISISILVFGPRAKESSEEASYQATVQTWPKIAEGAGSDKTLPVITEQDSTARCAALDIAASESSAHFKAP